jgi:prepilin-type N-terminal cleavage/methylation domain-containing protein
MDWKTEQVAVRVRVGCEMQPAKAGFTLIELSIVLVIMGLVVGGVLVGQDLIRAAYIRAQISQIEKFNIAVNTFYGKYQALPGDMNATTATNYGFATAGRGGIGLGDGNGIIEGNTGGQEMGNEQCGEPSMFWSELTYANGMNINLVQGSFSKTTFNTCGGMTGSGVTFSPSSSGTIDNWLPAASLGGGNYVYVYSNGWWSGGWVAGVGTYIGLSVVSNIGTYYMNSTPGMTVKQAYDIDRKVDDGFPTSGRVLAQYVAGQQDQWANTSWGGGAVSIYAPPNDASSSTTCFNYNGSAFEYSLSQNKGAGLNCALSFLLKSGD